MIFKCKMCGGDITKIEGSNTGKCNYCKSVMTLPDSDNEKIVNLYNRANFLRMENDFDKAKEMYESILELDNAQLEAHWGLLLCKYGVEYVDDPKTKKKVPTCHRTEDKSILSDPDYKIIKKESFGEAQELYETEAKTIDEIQKGILAISKKESPYDVFICYKETSDEGERTPDSVIAQDIYDKLTEQGLKVFFARITLESKLGKEYEPYIYSALKTSKVMLVVGTKEEHFNAVWVKNEWSRYLEMMKKDKSKSLIPVYSKVDAYKLPEEFVMLQAQSMDKIGAMQDLVRGVKKLVEEYNPNIETEEEQISSDARNIGNGRYEVTIFKENLPTWYTTLNVLIGVIGAWFGLFILVGDYVYYGGYSVDGGITRHIIRFEKNSFPSIFLLLAIVLFVLAVISAIVNRKTYRKRKYFLLGGMTSLLLCYTILACYNYYPGKTTFLLYIIFTISLIVYWLINPSWKLNVSNKTIMEFDEKEAQLKKNKKVKDNFKKKENTKINKLLFIPLGIIFIILLIKVNHTFNGSYRTNEINPNVDQIKIEETKYIYDNYKNQNVIGFVKKGETYDVLEFVTSKDIYDEDSYYNSDNITIEYFKIKTEEGTEGYISCKETNLEWAENGENYKKIYIQANERDTSKRQIKIITEYINIRSNTQNGNRIGSVNKYEIYTVLEETTSDKGTTWYKIKTNTGIEGWITGGEDGEKYIEILN